MRILRLATSDDTLPTVQESERGYRIVEQAIAAETGQTVETTCREAWPDANLPAVIDRWIDSLQPDIVFFRVSSYWFTYQSVPLKLQRSRLGWPARMAANAGFASAARPWPGNTAAFNTGRNALRRVVGSAVHFTPEQVIEAVTACIRRVLQHENVVLVVRGPLIAETAGCSRAIRDRAEEDRRRVDRAIARLCAEVHVHYTGCREAPPLPSVARFRGPDRLHLNAAGHRRVGIEEAQAHLTAWHRSRGADLPLYLETDAVT
jgi:hypothetical protein